MDLFSLAASGSAVRVRLMSGPFAGDYGTLTLYDTSRTGKQLFLILLDGHNTEVFLYPDSYKVIAG